MKSLRILSGSWHEALGIALFLTSLNKCTMIIHRGIVQMESLRGKSVIKKELIEEVKDRLVKAYNPNAIYLFGSYAWGTPTEDSDLDILVVVEKSSEKTYRRPIPGYDALFGLGISKDLIVYTQEEFDKYAHDITTLCYKIKQDGELMYAKS